MRKTFGFQSLNDAPCEIQIEIEFGNVARAERAFGFGGVADIHHDADFGTAASAGEAAGFGGAACFSGAGAACFGVAAAVDFGFSRFSFFFEPLNRSDQKPAWLAGIGSSANTTTDATIVQP